MSEHDLTSFELKSQYFAEIAKSETFRTNGISEVAAKDYLNTSEGTLYWQRLAEADPLASTSKIDERAIEQLTSGLDLPRMVTIEPNEPLVKLTRLGDDVSLTSPYLTKQSVINEGLASGRSLHDYFGLPARSEALRYRMDEFRAFAPTEVFISRVAPTSELGGQITRDGGGEQYLVPNRTLFSGPTRLRGVDNTLNLATEVERGGLAPNLIRGASVLGAAAVVYDATTTAARVSELREQGNTVGGQSDIAHFGGRNLGALGGAALGAELFGTAGAETGPLDVVVAGVGAIGGAIGGERLAEAYDRHRIYNQTDTQGITWNHDPAKSQEGWTREVPTGEVGYSSNQPVVGYGAMPAPLMRTIRADPALADRLTFQANNTAVDLALAHPATPHDPYTQPAGPHDTPSVATAPWRRDSQTQQWSRHVTDQYLEHGLTRTHDETAPPARAAQLDAAAQHTITANLAGSRRGMAEHYKAMYAQRGWAQYGAMPEAVTNALQTPTNTLQAADGNTYTRGTDGQWSTPGVLWGKNAADGHVRAELDATQRSEQAAATAQANRHEAPGLRTFSDPDHPQHALYAKLKETMPSQTSEARLAQATAACHTHHIDADNLGHIQIDAKRMMFAASWPPGSVAQADLTRPPPGVQQSVQHVQVYDQQQMQQMTQFHVQQAQINAQAAPGMGGPRPGGPGF